MAGKLSGGRTIAGTGSLTWKANVEAVGGVRQKVIAAARAGADYFLVPLVNEAGGPLRSGVHGSGSQVTNDDAIRFLQKIASAQAS